MENNTKLKNKNVETYTEDMVKAIESDKGGLIKKIINEEEEHEAQKKNLSPKSRKNRIFMFVGIVLIFLSLCVLIFLTFFYKSTTTVPIAPQAASIIFTDQTDFEAIDGFSENQIVGTVLKQINNPQIETGKIEGIYLTENNKVIGFQRFNTLIKSNLVLNQAGLISDNFLLGAYNGGTEPASSTSGPVSSRSDNGDFFMLLKVNSFPDIFPIMRVWENKMLYDLSPFFGINISSDTNYLFTKDFEDGIVANKNARILYDNNGNIVLMYVFIDNNSIVITNSQSAVSEIISRLNSGQVNK